MDIYMMFAVTMRVLELGCSIITAASVLTIAYTLVQDQRQPK